MTMQMKSVQDDSGRWVVAFSRWGDEWSIEPESETFATREECERSRLQMVADRANENASPYRHWA